MNISNIKASNAHTTNASAKPPIDSTPLIYTATQPELKLEILS